MDIIFLLFKILCIILQVALVLVLVIIFLLLVIIFANIKYQIKVNTISHNVYDNVYKNTLDANVKVSYILSIFKVLVNKKDDDIRILVKVFNKGVFKTSIKNDIIDNIIYKNNKKEFNNQQTDDKEDAESNIADNDDKVSNEQDLVQVSEKQSRLSKKTLKKQNGKNSRVEKQEDIDLTEVFGEEEQVEQTEAKNEKSKKIKKEDKVVTFVDTLKNKEVILKTVNAVFKCLSTLKPQVFKARFKFGFYDPSLTGKVVGVCYTIQGMTGLDIVASGEFQDVIEPDIFVYTKGETSIFRLIRPFFFLAILFIKFKIKTIFDKLKNKKGD